MPVSSLMPLATAAILDSIFGPCLAFASRLHKRWETGVDLTSYIIHYHIWQTCCNSWRYRDFTPFQGFRKQTPNLQFFFSSACRAIKDKISPCIWHIRNYQYGLTEVHLLSPQLAAKSHSEVKWNLFSSLLSCPDTQCMFYFSNNGPVPVDST